MDVGSHHCPVHNTLGLLISPRGKPDSPVACTRCGNRPAHPAALSPPPGPLLSATLGQLSGPGSCKKPFVTSGPLHSLLPPPKKLPKHLRHCPVSPAQRKPLIHGQVPLPLPSSHHSIPLSFRPRMRACHCGVFLTSPTHCCHPERYLAKSRLWVLNL